MKILVISILILLNCEIKKNPLRPNGPFGLFNLYFNFSKVGNWKYQDRDILYYSVNEKIYENKPEVNPLTIITSGSSKEPLPDGLFLNSKASLIGTPTTIQSEKEYTVYANNFFFKNDPSHSTNIKMETGNFNMSNGINAPIDMLFHFPTNNNFTYSNYSVSPDLPTDLILNKDTGRITSKLSGATRDKVSDEGAFKISATRSDGIPVVGSGAIRFTKWIHEAYLKAPNAEAGDNLGGNTSVNTANPLSISGDTIVVGAWQEDSIQTTITNGTLVQASDQANDLGVGAVYVFRRTGSTWVNEAYLKAPNAEGGATGTGDRFGLSTSISGDTIVVGADYEDSNQTTITNGTNIIDNNLSADSGAAYVFRRTGSIWIHEAYLKAPNAGTGDVFGNSVSIDADTIVVGAFSEDSNQTTITNGTSASPDNSFIGSGAAYVFRRNGSTWSNEAYLKAPNAGGFDRFGWNVGISGDTIVISAISEDSNQTTITNGTTTNLDNSFVDSGAAYVFRRNGTIWSNEAYLKAPNAEGGINEQFGWSLSISGDTIIVGTPFEDSDQTTITNGTLLSSNNAFSGSGAAYVFRRTGVIWSNEAYLKAPNAEAGDNFGRRVSISGNTIVVGAINEASNQNTFTNGITASADNSLSGSGAVYVFKRTVQTWYNEAYLKAPNAGGGDRFGETVAIDGDTIVVGANSEDSNQTTITNGSVVTDNNLATDSGAVYVFRRVSKD